MSLLRPDGLSCKQPKFMKRKSKDLMRRICRSASVAGISLALGAFSRTLYADAPAQNSDQLAQVVHDTSQALNLEKQGDITAINQAIAAAANEQQKELFQAVLI